MFHVDNKMSKFKAHARLLYQMEMAIMALKELWVGFMANKGMLWHNVTNTLQAI